MSSYASVIVRDRVVLSFRNEVEPTFFFLFGQADIVRITGPEAGAHPRYAANYDPLNEDDPDVDPEVELVLLEATVADLRDRLDALGIGRAAVEHWYRELRNDLLARNRRLEETRLDPVISRRLGEVADLWQDLSFDRWVSLTAQRMADQLKSGSQMEPNTTEHMLSLWDEVDSRVALRAILEVLGADEVVCLDVTPLIDSGWLDCTFDPQHLAEEHFGYVMANGTPAVILTEGSSDVSALEQAVRVLKPHLASYLKFFDFSFNAQGGAPALVRTLRSFAAAGISNRVVAVFDNDSAARDAMRSLSSTALPRHFVVISLPALELARSYPTLGPTGEQPMDVNGLAGSIELYMGLDALRDDSGRLRPVQWKGYVAGVDAYQGEVLGKSEVIDAYNQKVRIALAEPAVRADQDWSGMELILSAVLSALGEQVPSDPLSADG